MFASYAVFGHHRPLNAVIVVGIVLLGEHVVDLRERAPVPRRSSASRRCSCSSARTSSTSRPSGSAAGSATRRPSRRSTCAAGPCSSGRGHRRLVLPDPDGGLGAAGRRLGRRRGRPRSACRDRSRGSCPTGGSTRPGRARASGRDAAGPAGVEHRPGVAMTIQRDPSDTTEYYWRAYTYDRIDLKGWALTEAAEIDVGRGPADPGRARRQRPTRRACTASRSRSTRRSSALPTMISPATPGRAPARTSADDRGHVGLLRHARAQRRPGRVQGHRDWSPSPATTPGQLNESALEAASTTYPDDIKALYLTPLPARMLGTDGLQLEAKILAEAQVADAPYDIAKAAERELQSIDLPLQAPTSPTLAVRRTLSVAECFARFKQGFCQYYATTMAVDPARRGHPGPRSSRASCRATSTRGPAIETIQFSQRARLGRGLLPGLRLGPVRPDRPVRLPRAGRCRPVRRWPARHRASSASSTRRRPAIPEASATSGPSGVHPCRPAGAAAGPLVAVGFLLLVVVVVRRVPGLAPRAARADQRRRRLRHR